MQWQALDWEVFRTEVARLEECQHAETWMLVAGAMHSAAVLAGPSQQLPNGLHDSAEHHRVTDLGEHFHVSVISVSIRLISSPLSAATQRCALHSQADLQEGCMLPPSKHLLVGLHDRVKHRHSPICALQLLDIEGMQILGKAHD